MSDVRVYFATNRNHQPENTKLVFGPHFNPDGVAALRFGHADFADGVDTLSRAKLEVYPDIGTPDPRVAVSTATGGGRLLESLREAMCQGRDTLVFIHGFNVSFNAALEAGARLARQVRIPGPGPTAPSSPVNVVVFSWPSDGAAVPLMSYYSDREDARASGPALARAYFKLRDFLVELHRKDAERIKEGLPSELCDRGIHLMAHSMGAYVLRQGVQALLAKEADGLVRVFDQILLASPDEDDDTFEYETKLKLLPRLGKRVTVYFNPKDKALWISDKTKTNPDRLGADGPRLIDLIPKKVALVDCRRVAGLADPRVEHSYYVNSLAMSGDIRLVLAGVDIDEIPNREWVGERRVWRIARELV